MYLPEDLNVKKVFTMFKELLLFLMKPTDALILNSEFNISFGNPRTDTCKTCDKFLAKLKTLSPDKDEN